MSTLPVYPVRRASGAIHVDGLLDEFDWLAAPRLEFVKFWHDPEGDGPLRSRTRVEALWDDDALYFGFIVEDREIWSTLSERDARLWPEECVELFIDPGGDGARYVEAQFNSLNNVRDLLIEYPGRMPEREEFDRFAKWDFRELKKAVRVYRTPAGDDVGWTLELAVPWSDLGFSGRAWPPVEGDELRVNLFRFERAQDGSLPVEFSGWSRLHGRVHDPSCFGRFVFCQ